MLDQIREMTSSTDSRDEPKDVHYECRRCGISVSAGTEECPGCNATTIARIELA